jgi:hypothetical protein
MDDKRTLLKQIGWSDELIDKCLSGEILSDKNISVGEYRVSTAFEQDTTTLNVNIDTPIISDGTHLIQ